MKDKNYNSAEDEELFSLTDFLKQCLRQWKWFLASLIFFTGVGIFYLYRKEPVYTRSMDILVKDQSVNDGVSSIANSFSYLGFGTSNPKVYNELIAFKSPAVMMEVVKRLNLTMNYKLKDGLKKKTLYNTSNPYDVVFESLGEDEAAGFRMQIHPNGTFVLSKVWKSVPGGVEKFEGTFAGSIPNGPVNTPVGKVLIERNPDFKPGPDWGKEEVTIDVTKNGYLSTVQSYQTKLKGDLADQDADVIDLSINDESIARANDVLNAVVQVYNERWIEDKNKIAIATSKFISERLKVIEAELGNVDNQISEFKSEIGIPDLAEAGKGLMEQDFKTRNEIINLESQIAMTTFLKDYLENPKNRHEILPSISGTNNTVLENQITAYNSKLIERNNLAQNSSEANPLVQDMDSELVGLRNAILQSTKGNIANLESSMRQFDKAQSESRNQLSNAPKQANTLLSAERKQLVMQELYLYLLQKREETELTQSYTSENIRVITPPFGPLLPGSPKKALIIIIAALLGLAIPAVALYIADASNNAIRSKKDLDGVQVPFAGEIPFVGKKRRLKKMLKTKKGKQREIDKPKVVVKEGQRDIPNEAFRVVRSNIDFMIGKSEKASVLVFTSFNPGSGKSFVAYNIGASFSLKGKKVLLIDGDLRHASLSGYVDSPKKGLVDYLAGDVSDWQTLIKKAPDLSNLFIMPIGHKPPNPAELLENGRFESMINEARDQYDLIMIDCPPINIVVDTQIINRLSDRTIFVVRAGLFSKSDFKEVEKIYKDKKLNNMSLLLNGTTSEFSTYHTYGSYGTE